MSTIDKQKSWKKSLLRVLCTCKNKMASIDAKENMYEKEQRILAFGRKSVEGDSLIFKKWLPERPYACAALLSNILKMTFLRRDLTF